SCQHSGTACALHHGSSACNLRHFTLCVTIGGESCPVSVVWNQKRPVGLREFCIGLPVAAWAGSLVRIDSPNRSKLLPINRPLSVRLAEWKWTRPLCTQSIPSSSIWPPCVLQPWPAVHSDSTSVLPWAERKESPNGNSWSSTTS